MKKLMLILAITGVVFFFPFKIGESTCLFGHISGICIYDLASHKEHSGHIMLSQYLRYFALFWWGSIGLLVYIVHNIRKSKREYDYEI